MPRYSFVCQKCKNEFLVWATFEEYDRKDSKKFRCPKCGSKTIKQTFSDVFFIRGRGNRGNKNIGCSCGS